MRQLILPIESMLQSITNKSNDLDHSCLASHGIVAVKIGVVFKTESEVSQSVQEFVEEGEIHMVVHASSTLADQATLNLK